MGFAAQMVSGVVFFAIIFLIVVWIRFIIPYRRLKTIEATPTTLICKAHTFRDGQIIEVKGTISGDKIIAPYALKECLFYDSDRYEEYSPGRDVVKRRIDIERVSSKNLLYISDKTGKIRVDITSFQIAEFCICFKVDTDSERERCMLTPKNRALGAKVFIEEYYLPPASRTAYILGVYRSITDGGYICANPSGSGRTVFAFSSEVVLKEKLSDIVSTQGWSLLFVGSILAAMLTLLALVW